MHLDNDKNILEMGHRYIENEIRTVWFLKTTLTNVIASVKLRMDLFVSMGHSNAPYEILF